jgi:hypothetical protein
MGFFKATGNKEAMCRKKLSTQAAFGNPLLWVYVAFENTCVTPLAAF